jgi:hypothetical protein
MKTINLIALMALCCLNSLCAQQPKEKMKINRTWISLNSAPFKVEGVLYEVKDSSILVSYSRQVSDYSAKNFQVTNLNFINIREIQIRSENSIRNGIFIGAAAGLAIGFSLGMILGDDKSVSLAGPFGFSAGQKAIFYGVSFGFIGGVIGGSIGSIKLKIPIHGSMNNFNANKNKLRNYSFI